MVGVDREATVQFLSSVYEPTDWVAILLKSYERSGVAQRVRSISCIQSERFQRWLRAMNAQQYNVYVAWNRTAPYFFSPDASSVVVQTRSVSQRGRFR